MTYAGGQIIVTVALPGDANLDRAVNFDDLLALAQHYGENGTTWVTADFDGSGQTTFDDLLTLAQHYGTSGLTADDNLAALAGAGFAADWALAQSLVPEPASLAALALLGCTFSRRGGRQRRGR